MHLRPLCPSGESIFKTITKSNLYCDVENSVRVWACFWLYRSCVWNLSFLSRASMVCSRSMLCLCEGGVALFPERFCSTRLPDAPSECVISLWLWRSLYHSGVIVCVHILTQRWEGWSLSPELHSWLSLLWRLWNK